MIVVHDCFVTGDGLILQRDREESVAKNPPQTGDGMACHIYIYISSVVDDSISCLCIPTGGNIPENSRRNVLIARISLGGSREEERDMGRADGRIDGRAAPENVSPRGWGGGG